MASPSDKFVARGRGRNHKLCVLWFFPFPHYGLTTTVTLSVAMRAPSCATHRRTYSPGVLNVARTSHLLSGGIGGVLQPTAQGEFAPSRVSCHALNCGG